MSNPASPVLSPINTSNISSASHLPSPEISPIRGSHNASSMLPDHPIHEGGARPQPTVNPGGPQKALVPLLEALKYGTKQMAMHKVEMFGKHLSKLSEDGAGTHFGPVALRRAMEHMKMTKLSTQQSKLLFQSLNTGGNGTVDIGEFCRMFSVALRKYKTGQEKVMGAGQTQALQRTRVKSTKNYKNDMPCEQVYGMVVERLKALIMSNSIDIIRKFWNVADRQKHGVVDVNQMCSLLEECGVPYQKQDLEAVIWQYSSGKKKITFQDFVCNLLGFPHDFFGKSVDQSRQNIKKSSQLNNTSKQKTVLVKNNKELLDQFRLGLRKLLLNPEVSLSRVFNKTRSQESITKSELWTLLHTQHKGASESEMKMIMDRFDYDRDGKIDYQEFVHELLDIPLPAAIKKKLRTAIVTRQDAPPLEGRAKLMLGSLKEQCKFSSIQNAKLLGLFNKYDTDGSGRIAYDELKKMLQDLNITSDGDAAAALLTIIDRSGTGSISYTDFVKDVLQLSEESLGKINCSPIAVGPVAALRDNISKGIISKVTTSPDAHRKVFNYFDKDHAGSCSYGEFSRGIRALDLPLTTEQVRALWDNMERDILDEVDHKAFAKGMMLDGGAIDQLLKPRVAPKPHQTHPSASQSRRTSTYPTASNTRSASVASLYSRQPTQRAIPIKVPNSRSRCTSVASGYATGASLTLPPIKQMSFNM